MVWSVLRTVCNDFIVNVNHVSAMIYSDSTDSAELSDYVIKNFIG